MQYLFQGNQYTYTFKDITMKSRPAMLWILNGTTKIQGGISVSVR